MQEIFIDVVNGANNTINVIQGDNNCKEYKIVLTKNKSRINLTNKTIKLAFCNDNNIGNIIGNLKIIDEKNGEILLPITNLITKQDGIYSCQIAIYGENEYLEHTSYFSISVRENLFLKIGQVIPESEYSKLNSLLDGVSKLEDGLEKAENINLKLNNNSIKASKLIDEFNNLDLTNIEDTIKKYEVITLNTSVCNGYFCFQFPDGFNKNNTLVIQLIGKTIRGIKKQLNINIILDDLGIRGKVNKEIYKEWNPTRRGFNLFKEDVDYDYTEIITSVEIKLKKI